MIYFTDFYYNPLSKNDATKTKLNLIENIVCKNSLNATMKGYMWVANGNQNCNNCLEMCLSIIAKILDDYNFFKNLNWSLYKCSIRMK